MTKQASWLGKKWASWYWPVTWSKKKIIKFVRDHEEMGYYGSSLPIEENNVVHTRRGGTDVRGE